MSTIRASRPDSLGVCLASIRVAGERFMRARLSRVLNRVVGPTGFLYALHRIVRAGRPRARSLFGVR